MSVPFDPNAAATENSGIFGLPYTEEESSLVIVPVPWEVTTSYGGGTSKGPEAILHASHQVDLFDAEVLNPYEAGIFLKAPSSQVTQWNKLGKQKAKPIIEAGGASEEDPWYKNDLKEINALGALLNDYVRGETKKILSQKKIPAILGGDHSVPFGAFQAVGETFPSFGILHIDAHSDTRNAYEGFRWSHASIMRNAVDEIHNLKKLVQVGIRDFCEEEFEYCQSKSPRVVTFYDRAVSQEKNEGKSWASICDRIVKELPDTLWISFDIDGLDPKNCPHTGTPVPGGLEFGEILTLLRKVGLSRKKIIGFDLNEVAPDPSGKSEWDANVGARLLYKMSAWTLYSQGKAKLFEAIL